jgi:hypothetical protein
MVFSLNEGIDADQAIRIAAMAGDRAATDRSLAND